MEWQEFERKFPQKLNEQQEEINSHLFNAVRMVLILTNISCGQRTPRPQ